MFINSYTHFGGRPNVLLYAKPNLTILHKALADAPPPSEKAHHKVGSLVDILILDQDRVVVLKNKF